MAMAGVRIARLRIVLAAVPMGAICAATRLGGIAGWNLDLCRDYGSNPVRRSSAVSSAREDDDQPAMLPSALPSRIT